MAAIPYAQDVQAAAYTEAQNPGAAYMETKTGGQVATNPSTGARVTYTAPQAIAGYQKMLAQGNAAISSAQSLERQNQALLAQLANKPVAPTLNYNAIQANAAKQASAQVNPLYTQYLNQYLQQESAITQQQQEANKLAIQGAQSQQQNTLAQNTQQQQFAGANTALNLGNINQLAANRQQNAGESYDAQRLQLEQQIGQSNLGASGIGQQQIWIARNKANIAELQAENSDQFNRNQQLLNESNTFAQIGQSNKYAATIEGQSESKANLDLSSYLQHAAYAETTAREQLTDWQQSATWAAQQNAIAKAVSGQLGALRGGVQGAAAQAWSPFLQTVGMPSMPSLGFGA